jgi:adenylate cyclase
VTGRNAAWRPAPVIEWLIRDAWRIANRRILVEELCGRLLAEGVPLWRFTAHTPTLHPEMMGDTFVWLRASGHASYETAAHAMKATPLFTRSPLLAAAKARAPLRRRLAGAEAELDFPLLEQLSREGATDYVVLPLEFSNGSLAFATLASDHPDGFSPAHLALFDDLRLVLARLAEVFVTRILAVRLLDTYVGRHAGERILRGQVLRGSGDTIRAALWFCDLRGFTALSDRLPRDELIALLNDYFDCMAAPLEAHGGEIVKFIGDAMLAIFPVGDKGDTAAACAAAFTAAQEARRGMHELNERRNVAGQPGLGHGIALHVGDVMFGNVGAHHRLDFTVIGPAVNLASRISGLCRTLGRDLVVSAALAEHLGDRVVSLGRHDLRGVAAAVELFGLPDDRG